MLLPTTSTGREATQQTSADHATAPSLKPSFYPSEANEMFAVAYLHQAPERFVLSQRRIRPRSKRIRSEFGDEALIKSISRAMTRGGFLWPGVW